MKILLRDILTGRYFQGPDSWSDDPERALDFQFTERALKCVGIWRLDQVELAFTSDGPEHITAVALGTAAPCEPRSPNGVAHLPQSAVNPRARRSVQRHHPTWRSTVETNKST
ncbi:hypothetical protein SBV1_480039 [Verrucomicrobia bacterium]|nr:hypothetical protein SBV1_480039 [Verrucomicrobiota bacterium]